MKFSIIIPTLNEARAVGPRVAACFSLRPDPEVIVADGGSGDRTANLARRAGAIVVTSPRGRGIQMNAGAAAASGEVLVFLHVDVVMPQQAWSALETAVARADLVGGAFRRRFDSPSRFLALGCRLADLRGAWLRLYLGDQAIFTRRAAFDALGGYPTTPLFEDLEFSRRLRRRGRTTLIRAPVLASARRFDAEGDMLRLGRNLCLVAAYGLGVNPERLARWYYPENCETGGAAREIAGTGEGESDAGRAMKRGGP